jgi:3-oxoacyl-[acyl-carrier protein] reductase
MARSLAAEGCRVCLTARGAERLEEARREIEAVARPESVLALTADLFRKDEVGRVVEGVAARFGALDILVNNLGVVQGGGFFETSDEQWQQAFDWTLFPAIWATRAAVPHMRRARGGAIVMVASIFGREWGGRVPYNAVKAAEISLAKMLSRELAPDNIRVNSVAPGSILFPGGSWHRRREADPEGIAAFVARELPFGRFGRPEEVGDVVAFLVSPRASWISGASITVDGAQSRSLI